MRVLKLGPIVEVTKLGYRTELCILRDVVAKGLASMTKDQPGKRLP